MERSLVVGCVPSLAQQGADVGVARREGTSQVRADRRWRGGRRERRVCLRSSRRRPRKLSRQCVLRGGSSPDHHRTRGQGDFVCAAWPLSFFLPSFLPVLCLCRSLLRVLGWSGSSYSDANTAFACALCPAGKFTNTTGTCARTFSAVDAMAMAIAIVTRAVTRRQQPVRHVSGGIRGHLPRRHVVLAVSRRVHSLLFASVPPTTPPAFRCIACVPVWSVDCARPCAELCTCLYRVRPCALVRVLSVCLPAVFVFVCLCVLR